MLRFTGVLICLLYVSLAAVADTKGADSRNSVGVANYMDRELSRESVRIVAPDVERYVQAVLKRLAQHSEDDGHAYVVRLLNDPLVNAYSPGPKYVYVTSGLLDLVESVDELAFVLGHELAHGKHNHVEKSVKRAQVNTAITDTLGAFLGAAASASLGSGALGQQGYEFGDRLGKAFGATMNVAMTSGHGRTLELEADRSSIGYMTRAGFDTAGAVSLARKMIELRDASGADDSIHESIDESLGLHFLGAQPGLEVRLTELEKHIDGVVP